MSASPAQLLDFLNIDISRPRWLAELVTEIDIAQRTRREHCRQATLFGVAIVCSSVVSRAVGGGGEQCAVELHPAGVMIRLVLATLAFGIHICDMEALLTYEGTAEIQTLLVGRDITGQSAFASDAIRVWRSHRPGQRAPRLQGDE